MASFLFRQLVLVLGLFVSVSAMAKDVHLSSCDEHHVPRFEDHRVADASPTKRASLQLNSPFVRRYKSTLQATLKGENISLAGHYVIWSEGCGTSCTQYAVIDVESGQAVRLQVPWLDFSENELETRSDSSLIQIVNHNEQLNDRTQGLKYRYYLWKNHRLYPMCER